jgi:hypothetical protein
LLIVAREVMVPVPRSTTTPGLGEHWGAVELPFAIPAVGSREPIRRGDGHVIGALTRTAASLSGRLTIAAEKVADDAYRLTVRIENMRPLGPDECASRNLAQRCSFASTHVLLGVSAGAFVSSIDPPPRFAEVVDGCENQGVWPVLVGDAGARGTMLAAPIILYDDPQIAAELPCDLFDATEIDEILSLRILTMTDAEKRDMAAVDTRARALLARRENLCAGDFMRLHGVMRPPFTAGDHVRLRPRRCADVMDIVLRDKIAVIEAIERDFADRTGNGARVGW